jgi:phosphoribosylanthranilate isomerase
MWVKICANTNVEDTLAAIEFGADAVGFVFAPSKRQVTTAQVRAITSALPLEIERVGVFPAWPASRIVEAAIHAGLTAVQLHGGYDPSITDAIQALVPTLDVIEVAHWTVGADAAARDAVARSVARLQAQSRGGEASRMLIDAKVDAVSGGTGVAFACARGRLASRERTGRHSHASSLGGRCGQRRGSGAGKEGPRPPACLYRAGTRLETRPLPRMPAGFPPGAWRSTWPHPPFGAGR